MARAPQYQSPYTELTPDELTAIIEATDRYKQWKEIRDLIKGIYGPTAHSLAVRTVSEYNDEYDETYIESILVQRKDGEPVRPDPTLPKSGELLKRYPWAAIHTQRERLVDLLRHPSEGILKLPLVSAVYLLDEEPALPKLYAKKREHAAFLDQQKRSDALMIPEYEEEEEDSDLDEYDGEREGYVYNDEYYVREEDINSDEPSDEDDEEEND